jgi:hypothetical protein
MDTTVDINGIFMANDGINMMGYNPFFYQKSCLLCQKKNGSATSSCDGG